MRRTRCTVSRPIILVPARLAYKSAYGLAGSCWA